MKVLVAIPCYNCEAQILRVLKKINSIQFPENIDFLIVDNKSNDGTRDVIKNELTNLKLDLKKHFRIIFHDQNYGLGGSFKTIVNYALHFSYDHFILFHGDDQASENDLSQMIKEVIDKNPDCLLGARFMKESRLQGYSRTREIGNKMINQIFSFFLARKIYDIGSGLNSYKLASLPKDQIPFYPDHIAFDVELLLHFMAPKNKYQAFFFPIQWFEKDQRSNANNFKVGFQVLTMLIKFKLGIQNLHKTQQERRYEVLVP